MSPPGPAKVEEPHSTDGITVIQLAKMAFETSTLVNGEWTTRTLDVDTVLEHYNQRDKEATTTFMEVEKTPTIGILTQTVIRSPLVHWILPVKLRDVETQHVAFIGVRIFPRLT